jgi:hypothetical protein
MMTAFDPLDHLDASLQDFELNAHLGSPTPPPQQHHHHQAFGYPSHRSGFRAATARSEAGTTEASASEPADSMLSVGGYSPPAWRRLGNGDRSSGFWRRTDDILGGAGAGGAGPSGHGRELSPELFDDDIEGDIDMGDLDNDVVLERAIRTRLPTGSLSPEKDFGDDRRSNYRASHGRGHSYSHSHGHSMGGGGMQNTTIRLDDFRHRSSAASVVPATATTTTAMTGTPKQTPGPPDNYIRFAVRAEVQHRTEPIETAIAFVRRHVAAATKSWTSMACSVLVAALSVALLRGLFQPASQRPVPDLVKVAGIARAFEPLIYFSENGASQVGDLQATGVAVWDLGESVRSSNMTSAPIIVKELDELSDSLKTLAMELTKFFANVDGDIDG